MGRDRTAVAEPPTLRERVAAIPLTPTRRFGWLPPIDTRGYTMFSAFKFIAAAVIVALFGGFLVAGVLTTPQDGEVAPATVTESPSPMATGESTSGVAFPTGFFISVDTGREMLEFHGDGTGLGHDPSFGTAPFTYSVDGDTYTALTGGAVPVDRTSRGHGPATYRWDYDGEQLTFDLIGEDTNDRRRTRLWQSFRPIEDPRVVMVATSDLDVGDPIRAWASFVDAAEVGLDAYTSKAEYADHVVAVPIAKGQPITPDLLEPRPSE
jgi:hypothetical protein